VGIAPTPLATRSCRSNHYGHVGQGTRGKSLAWDVHNRGQNAELTGTKRRLNQTWSLKLSDRSSGHTWDSCHFPSLGPPAAAMRLSGLSVSSWCRAAVF